MPREAKIQTLQDTVQRMVAENVLGIYTPPVYGAQPIKFENGVFKLHPHVGRPQSKEQIAKRVASRLSKEQKPHIAWNKGLKNENASKRKGVLSPYWGGGISPANELARKTPAYKEWRKAVYERDNYTCVECGDRKTAGNHVELNADHIKPFALNPSLRFDVSNGRTLCEPCHRKIETYGAKLPKQELLN
jgi:hypothetical protein